MATACYLCCDFTGYHDSVEIEEYKISQNLFIGFRKFWNRQIAFFSCNLYYDFSNIRAQQLKELEAIYDKASLTLAASFHLKYQRLN